MSTYQVPICGWSVQNDVQQRTVDLDTSVVPNEAEFSKFVHEETHACPCPSDHFRQRLLANFRDHRLRCLFRAEVCQQQEHASKTLLA